MSEREPIVRAEAMVPTRHGWFRFLVFRAPGDPSTDHVSLVRGDVQGEDVVVHIHSGCITSEVFGSLRCDCAVRLDAALRAIAMCGRGVVAYLRQDVRGFGVASEVRADASHDRAPSHGAAAAILRELGVRSVRLLTNSPAELEALERVGVRAVREPLAVR